MCQVAQLHVIFSDDHLQHFARPSEPDRRDEGATVPRIRRENRRGRSLEERTNTFGPVLGHPRRLERARSVVRARRVGRQDRGHREGSPKQSPFGKRLNGATTHRLEHVKRRTRSPLTPGMRFSPALEALLSLRCGRRGRARRRRRSGPARRARGSGRARERGEVLRRAGPGEQEIAERSGVGGRRAAEARDQPARLAVVTSSSARVEERREPEGKPRRSARPARRPARTPPAARNGVLDEAGEQLHPAASIGCTRTRSRSGCGVAQAARGGRARPRRARSCEHRLGGLDDTGNPSSHAAATASSSVEAIRSGTSGTPYASSSARTSCGLATHHVPARARAASRIRRRRPGRYRRARARSRERGEPVGALGGERECACRRLRVRKVDEESGARSGRRVPSA